MATTHEQIATWLQRAKANPDVTHVIVVCDTFEHEDYPVFVKKTEDIHERVKECSQGMQRVMEVYAMSMDLAKQLAEARAFHY